MQCGGSSAVCMIEKRWVPILKRAVGKGQTKAEHMSSWKRSGRACFTCDTA